ncbi:MAG: sugar phosphate isomerase/epimerase [Planctomycetota bacterium]|nr:sugar phosphate isomerase/epimerase [Planctomycetota bacterium]
MKKNQGHSKLSRRDFLATTAASFAAAGLMGAGCGNGMRNTFAKRQLPVGVQLYSVRAECAKDLPGTIAKVAAMGYDGVEFAGYYDYSAKDLRKILDDNGLKCCGTHTQMDTLSDANLDATIEFNTILGNKYLIVPWLQPNDASPKEAWLAYAKRFNQLAEKVPAHGMVVGYHCHAHDFHALDGGDVPWDILFGNTGKHVVMQMDTGNCMDGGGDPVAYLKKYPGRSLTVHLKEHSKTNKNAIIGEGDVPWDEVFSVCETIGGTQWYIIEEEKDVYPPLEAIELCLKNYRKLRA